MTRSISCSGRKSKSTSRSSLPQHQLSDHCSRRPLITPRTARSMDMGSQVGMVLHREREGIRGALSSYKATMGGVRRPLRQMVLLSMAEAGKMTRGVIILAKSIYFREGFQKREGKLLRLLRRVSSHGRVSEGPSLVLNDCMKDDLQCSKGFPRASSSVPAFEIRSIYNDVP